MRAVDCDQNSGGDGLFMAILALFLPMQTIMLDETERVVRFGMKLARKAPLAFPSTRFTAFTACILALRVEVEKKNK